jgi:hypothetical protein
VAGNDTVGGVFNDYSSTNATTGWHLYTQTWGVTNATMYLNSFFDGALFWVTNYPTAKVPLLRVGSAYHWLAIGCWHHEGTPQYDPPEGFPNCGWFSGAMDDIRIYNRTLAAADVGNLYAAFVSGSTNSPGTNSPTGSAPGTNSSTGLVLTATSCGINPDGSTGVSFNMSGLTGTYYVPEISTDGGQTWTNPGQATTSTFYNTTVPQGQIWRFRLQQTTLSDPSAIDPNMPPSSVTMVGNGTALAPPTNIRILVGSH